MALMPDSLQMELTDALRRYLKAEVAPMVDAFEAESKPVPREVVQAMRDFGLLGGLLPEAQGGYGLSMTTYGLLIAEVARVWPSLRSIISTSNLAASIISESGSDAMRATYLPGLLSGELLACFALSEPNIGSDAARIETRATPTPQGWAINGRKLYISLGTICDIGVVFAQTAREDGTRGVSCLLFERGMTGFSSSAIPKMGMHSCPLGELLFDNVQVPAGNLIGAAGGGFGMAKKYLNLGRCVVAFSALGIAERAYEAAVDYVLVRSQFGRLIGGFQLVQQMIADMMTLVETSRLLCMRAAHAVDSGAADSELMCSMAKRHATDAVLRVAELSMQVHGGAGYTTLFPIERYYRDARHLSIVEGTNQIQALLMAQKVLGISAIK